MFEKLAAYRIGHKFFGFVGFGMDPQDAEKNLKKKIVDFCRSRKVSFDIKFIIIDAGSMNATQRRDVVNDWEIAKRIQYSN